MSAIAPISPGASNLKRFQSHTLSRSSMAPTSDAIASQLPVSSRPASRAFTPLSSTARYAVQPLTSIALDALVRGFEKNPSLRGMPASFAAAVARRLPTDLDVRLTAPSVHDENYWKRACEARGWTNGKIELSEHGFRWKQAFCELYIASELAKFGQYQNELPVSYEEEFCRPPIDSTHPRWQSLYRRMAPKRLDGKPNRERFAKSAIDENDLDGRILSSSDCGWAHLEKLKALCKANMPVYETQYAWAAIDKNAHLAACAAEEAAANAPPPPPPAEGEAVSIQAPPSLLAVPYSIAAGKARDLALKAAQRAEDAFDCKVEGAGLREFVEPEALSNWKVTTAWPPHELRGDSILTTRARELQTLLDRIQSCEDHVFHLVIPELPSHLDLELVTSRLPNLTSLDLTYAPKTLGMRLDSNSSKTLLKMQMSDAEAIARCLKTQDTILTSLSLHANSIDDALVAVLMQGLLANRTITHLDLSHNLIGDTGVALIARMLRAGAAHCVLSSLRLADNHFGAPSAAALGSALARPDSIMSHLDLRMNLIGDEGGLALIQGLIEGYSSTTLISLNLSNCGIGPKTAEAFAKLISLPNCSLVQCDLSANNLNDESVQAILTTLEEMEASGRASRICALELRANSGVDPNTIAKIKDLVYANEVKARGGMAAPLLGTYRKTFPPAAELASEGKKV
jgi:hypothetical protein